MLRFVRSSNYHTMLCFETLPSAKWEYPFLQAAITPLKRRPVFFFCRGIWRAPKGIWT